MPTLNAYSRQTGETALDNEDVVAGLLDAPKLQMAMSEIETLWKVMLGSLEGARTGLYNFLGATYEHAGWLAQDASALRELRLKVRRRASNDKQRKRVERFSAEELLLFVALGDAQASLRSKYKKLLAKAREAAVGAKRESFNVWLRDTGGIVRALKDAVELDSPSRPQPTGVRPFASCASDLLRNLTSQPVEPRSFAKAAYNGFTVVLFYRDPTTGKAHVMSELTDSSLVENAVRLAVDERAGVPTPATAQAA